MKQPGKTKPAIAAYDERGRPASRAYTQRLADLKAAFVVVGDTAASRLSWVTQFVAENPSTWQSGTRAVHGNCILALTGFAFPENVLGGVPLPAPLPPEDVDEVHRELSKFLRDAVTGPAGRPLFLPHDAAARVGLVRASGPYQKPARWGNVYRYTSPLGLLPVVRDLIVVAGHRLVACRYCQSPLVAFKKQQFCGEPCAQKFRNDKKAARRRTS